MNNSAYLKNIFILIFVIIASVCEGQQSITWQKLYPGPYDDDDIGYDICAVDDEYFYLAGGVASSQVFPRFYVIKINAGGQKLWAREIPGINGTGFARCVTSTLGGGCVMSGDAARFVKLDANGGEEINVPLSGAERRIYDIKRTSDNNFIACGRYEVNNSLLIKFDSLGKVIWEKIYFGSFLRRLYSLDEAINGGYIATGIKVDDFSAPLELNIIKTDTSGNLQWERDYLGYGGNSLSKLNNYYLTCGGIGFSKFDTNGNRFDSVNVNGLGISEEITDMKILSNNRYVYCTEGTQGLGDTYARILISDSSGNVVRSTLFDYSEFIYLTSILRINENNMIFFGAAYYDTIPKSNFYAIRTDSLFNIPPVGIKSSSIFIPTEFKIYQNYPNPFNNSTIIEFDIIKDDYYEMRIYNSLGQSVDKILTGFQKKGNYKIRFNSKNLSSGVYFYRLSNGTISETNSLILLK